MIHHLEPVRVFVVLGRKLKSQRQFYYNIKGILVFSATKFIKKCSEHIPKIDQKSSN